MAETKRPTIAELEEILNSPHPPKVTINPDGSVTAYEVEIWVREIDEGTDNACWVVCTEWDPGAKRAVVLDN